MEVGFPHELYVKQLLRTLPYGGTPDQISGRRGKLAGLAGPSRELRSKCLDTIRFAGSSWRADRQFCQVQIIYGHLLKDRI